ncbi:neurotrimin-like [Penaeus vannamei]|uniref:neurotrimin-like n=1 Tax=Penaeus vannamei TaxID=6689 RepID=UPI00387F96D9
MFPWLKSYRWTKMAALAVYLLAHVALAGGALSEEPYFVEPIQNVTIAAGRDVKLSCVVDNLSTYKVAWIAFDKSAILTVQDSVITRNPRVNVSHDGQRTWTLHLSKVNASDAGTYMCQVNTIVAKSQFGVLNVVVWLKKKLNKYLPGLRYPNHRTTSSSEKAEKLEEKEEWKYRNSNTAFTPRP